MNVLVQCPTCNAMLQIPAELLGKRVRCTACRQSLVAEAAPAPPSTPPAPLPMAVPVKRPAIPPALPVTSPAAVRPGPAPIAAPIPAAPPPRPTPVLASSIKPATPHLPTPAPPQAPPRTSSPASSATRHGKSHGRWILLGVGSATAVTALAIVLVATLGGSGAKKNSNDLQRASKENNKDRIAKNDKTEQGANRPSPPTVPVAQEPDLPPKVPAEFNPAAIKKVKDATVLVRVRSANGRDGEGSGFFSGDAGLVITNAHVVGMMFPHSPKPSNVSVVIRSGLPNEQTLPATILSSDGARDLAVLRVDAEGTNLPAPLAIGAARHLNELQTVYIFGFPLGSQIVRKDETLTVTVRKAEVSSLRNDSQGGVAKIQLEGGIDPGNSGGPVVDARGVVVGVAVAQFVGTNIKLAVPAEHLAPLLSGQIRETDIGEAFRDAGKTKLPVRIVCGDPLQRIRQVQLEVWTGMNGPGRPASSQSPAAQPADGPKTTVTLRYQDGVASGDVDLPDAKPGTALWLQPVLTNQAGAKTWAAVEPFVPSDEPPLERQAVALQFARADATERTLQLKNTFQSKITRGNQELNDVDTLEATVLESLRPEPSGVSVVLHPHEIRHTSQQDGLPVPLNSRGSQIASRLLPRFLLSPDGALKERSQPDALRNVAMDVRPYVNSLFQIFTNSYEATALPLPGNQVQPLGEWSVRLPYSFLVNGQTLLVDLNLKCRFEGRRRQQGKNLAYIRVTGTLQNRSATAGADGRVDGHALFDLEHGFISSAEITVNSELGANNVLVRESTKIELARQTGNPFKIAKLDTAKQKWNTVRPVTLGKVILDVQSDILATDPVDKQPSASVFKRPPGGRYKEFRVKLTQGVAYVFDMKSREVDPFLRLEDSDGKVVAEDDDSGGNLDARIVYTPTKSGEHRIIATVFDPGRVGKFTLSVAEVRREEK